MAAVVRKKQDDKYLQVLRELVTNGGGNRQCFDCGQKGPTYVNMTIGSFVCTRCSGVLRGLTPPHRVKSISMATFTQDDIDYLKNHGNDECAKTWLGLWDPKRAVHQDQRELMIDKYERKRYYLEPASPLKSLTNAVSLKSGSTAAGTEVPTTSGARAAAIAGTTSTTASSGSNALKSVVDGHTDLVHVVNGFGHNTKSQYRQQSGNAERSFELTPPSTQRTTMNGLHKAVTGAMGSTSNSGKATSAISRPQHQQNGYSDLQEAFMQKCNKNMNNNAVNNNNNELNVLHMTTSRMSDSGSATSMNGFGADADFVADFGSASIFDATMVNHNQMSSPPKLNRSGGAISSNGYAKIQPLKRQQYHSLNAHDQTNGTSSQSESIGNATSENFADFEHAPIFNAAENYQFVRKTVIKRRAGGQQSDRADPKAPTVREESLTQNQFRTLAHDQTNGTSSQSEFIGNATSENFADFEHAPIFNAAGLPIPNNNSRSMNTQQSNSQNNKNNALSSTPSEDRYAALKDLDEQLRESKAAATVVTAYGADTFGHTGICNSVNPFKHQQVNPFQAATHGTSPTATQSYFGQMTVISNGNGISSQQPTTATQFYNYSNGYVNATTTAGTATVMATRPSGCGFSLGALQPTAIAATGAGGGGALNNPFTATGAMNSNNPFL